VLGTLRDSMDVWCAIRTYPKHAEELGNPIPQEPVFFLKSTSSVVSFGQIDTCGGDVHHEVELVLKLGENLMPTEMALGLDLTKRSVQDRLKAGGLPWAEAKAFAGSTVIGDWVKYNPNAEYGLKINGNEVQRGSLVEMSWTPRELIDKLSNWAPIMKGDVLFTGTPAGVGPLVAGDAVTASLYLDGACIDTQSADCV
jgi:2-keto-4-pentenoate hydratase/2-oxohepta-3-ene-1,7-dioic acid hydratase in catechol pathway